MFQEFVNFFENIGVDPSWMFIIFGLSFVRCLVPNKLEYKIREVENKADKDKKEYQIFKML